MDKSCALLWKKGNVLLKNNFLCMSQSYPFLYYCQKKCAKLAHPKTTNIISLIILLLVIWSMVKEINHGVKKMDGMWEGF